MEIQEWIHNHEETLNCYCIPVACYGGLVLIMRGAAIDAFGMHLYMWGSSRAHA
jgi:hypothetical protein